MNEQLLKNAKRLINEANEVIETSKSEKQIAIAKDIKNYWEQYIKNN